jgi:hypothetical protein
MLQPTCENFRAEIARHKLTRTVVAGASGMHPIQVSQFVNGLRPLTFWAAHNLGTGINTTTGLRIFSVDPDLGLLQAPRGRPSHRVRLPTRRRKRPWRMRVRP